MKRPKSIPSARDDRRRPENVAEGLLFDQLTSDGWEVFKRGWPDFLAVRNGKVLIIEVKPTKRHRLKRDQAFVAQLLADAGLHVAAWNPETGYRRIMPSQKHEPTT